MSESIGKPQLQNRHGVGYCTRLSILGDLQIQVMNIIWSQGEQTVHQVHDALASRGTIRAYTTILSVMRILVKNNALSSRKIGRKHFFSANYTLDEYRINLMAFIRDEFFEGDYRSLAHFVKASKMYARKRK